MNLPTSALNRVRSVSGVQSAVPLALAQADARFPNRRFQSFQVIGVDDATLTGVPLMKDGATASVLRSPDAVIVDPGGTSGKLGTPLLKADQWPRGRPHLDGPTRPLIAGDELLNLKYYAVLNAMGARTRTLLMMICVQAALCALFGTGLGLGLCALAGRVFVCFDFPYRMMWFAPVVGGTAVVLVSIGAAAFNVRPIMKMQPASFLAGR